jgi:hypothetical protein
MNYMPVFNLCKMKKDLAHRSCVGRGRGGFAVLPTLVPLNNVYYVHKIDVLACLSHPSSGIKIFEISQKSKN